MPRFGPSRTDLTLRLAVAGGAFFGDPAARSARRLMQTTESLS